MQRILDSWYSPSLDKKMEIAVYGHYGFALLMIPSAAADYLEYERFHVIEAIRPMIEEGRFRVFSINSINAESWLNERMPKRQRSIRHQQYNRYVENEVVPYINNATRGGAPIITTGVSLGALHAANMAFRRPDLFDGTVAMSGIYDLKYYTGGYWDEDVYFNSPVDYLANMQEGHALNALRSKRNFHFLTGSGPYEDPSATRGLGNILTMKGIPHNIEVWGPEWRHDWPTWRAMLPSYLGRHF